jgi:hypothetical protein
LESDFLAVTFLFMLDIDTGIQIFGTPGGFKRPEIE